MPHVAKLAIFLAAAALLASGCQYGPMEPNRRAVMERREAWLDALKAAVVSDEVVYVSDRGDFEPVQVKALPLTDSVLAKAAEIWPDDKRLREKLAQWGSQGRAVILVGVYARGLKSSPSDFLKENPFSMDLVFPGVGEVPADPPEMVDKAFAADYFPVFNRWEKVLAYSFKTSLAPGSVLAVSWPTGWTGLELSPQPGAAAAGGRAN